MTQCIDCGGEDIHTSRKAEATLTKLHRTCNDCGARWTDRDMDGGLEG